MKDSTFGGVYLGVYTEEQDLCIKHQHEACRSERPNSICPLSDRTNIKYYSSSPPKVHTLQRCKGQGRDAGFWLKVISPGGSKTFKRRRNQYVSDINKENRLPSTDEDISPSELEVFSPTSDEVFTDNWEKALQWSSEEFEKFQSTTLPRNHKCQLPSVRQSLPGMMKTTAFRCSSPVPISNSMSPYNFLKTRIINRASRLSSPSKGSQKYLKTDLTNRDLPSHLSFKCRSKAYSHSRTSSCSEKSQTADNPNDDIEASIRLLAEDYSSCTLPRPGLTQLPPTPLSPRRHTSSTWKSRLSATAKELQAISANTLNAIAGSQSSDAVLHGHDVVIDWVGEGGVAAAEKKWPRKHSLPRHYQRQQQPPSHAATASDNEGGGSVGSSDCSAPSEGSAGDRVQGWATSLEKLLDDPAGLHTFAEFLKKEYSHENIYFWTACERYRLGIGSESPTPCSGSSSERPWAQWSGRHACAAAIYNTHLGNNASEPVNVDSQARQVAQEGLHQPTQDLFAAAQKQVFNLMKFDSYSRFLKSGLYQECLEREARGDCHQFAGEEALDPNLRIHQQSPTVDQQHNNNNNVRVPDNVRYVRNRVMIGMKSISVGIGEKSGGTKDRIQEHSPSITNHPEANVITGSSSGNIDVRDNVGERKDSVTGVENQIIIHDDAKDENSNAKQTPMHLLPTITLCHDDNSRAPYKSEDVNDRVLVGEAKKVIIQEKSCDEKDGLNQYSPTVSQTRIKNGSGTHISDKDSSRVLVTTRTNDGNRVDIPEITTAYGKDVRSTDLKLTNVLSTSENCIVGINLHRNELSEAVRTSLQVIFVEHVDVFNNNELPRTALVKNNANDPSIVAETHRLTSVEPELLVNDAEPLTKTFDVAAHIEDSRHQNEVINSKTEIQSPAEDNSDKHPYSTVRRRRCRGRQRKKDFMEDMALLRKLRDNDQLSSLNCLEDYGRYIDAVFDSSPVGIESFGFTDLHAESENDDVKSSLDKSSSITNDSSTHEYRYDSLGLSIPDDELSQRITESNLRRNINNNNNHELNVSQDSLGSDVNKSSLLSRTNVPIRRFFSSIRRNKPRDRANGGSNTSLEQNNFLVTPSPNFLFRRNSRPKSVDGKETPENVDNISDQEDSTQFSYRLKEKSKRFSITRMHQDEEVLDTSQGNHLLGEHEQPNNSSDCPYLAVMKREKSFVKGRKYNVGEMPSILK